MADLRELMRRYQDGDAGAFRELYAEVAPRLLGYLMKMARSRAVAEDLLQQTFLKVHRARSAYVQGADPLPWIYSIAHRSFIDEARRTKRAIVRVGSDPEGELPEIAAGITGLPADRTEEPIDPEEAKAALAALQKLPDAQREAVVLTKLEGKSVAEAAEIAGTTVGAMKVRAHRGYEALRKLLRGTGNTEVKRAAAGMIVLGLLVVLGVAAAFALAAAGVVALAAAHSSMRTATRLPDQKNHEESKATKIGARKRIAAEAPSSDLSVLRVLCGSVVQISGARPVAAAHAFSDLCGLRGLRLSVVQFSGARPVGTRPPTMAARGAA